MAKGDMGNPRVKQPSGAQAPKSTARIAGLDYCLYPDGRSRPDSDELCDDFVNGLTTKNSPGGPYGSGR